MRALLQTAVLILGTASSAHGADQLREGLWEISVQAEASGLPALVPPTVVRQCMNQQSVQDLMSQMGGAGACQVSDLQRAGSKTRWKLNCTGQFDVSGTGETEIGADSFSGRMTLMVNIGGQSLPMAQDFNGHRVGECK